MRLITILLAAAILAGSAAAQVPVQLVCKGTEVSSLDDQTKPFETSIVLRKTKGFSGKVTIRGTEMDALFTDDAVMFSDDNTASGIRTVTSGKVDRTNGAFHISRMLGEVLIHREGVCAVQKARKF